jgi:hypothetical protein
VPCIKRNRSKDPKYRKPETAHGQQKLTEQTKSLKLKTMEDISYQELKQSYQEPKQETRKTKQNTPQPPSSNTSLP